MQDELVVRAQHGDVEAFSSLTAGRMPAALRDRPAHPARRRSRRRRGPGRPVAGLARPPRHPGPLAFRRMAPPPPRPGVLPRRARRYRRRMRVEVELSPSIEPVRARPGRRPRAGRAAREGLPAPVDRSSDRPRPDVYYVGLTMAETAEIIGVPLGTVQSRLNRATSAMRAALEADERAASSRPEPSDDRAGTTWTRCCERG